MFKIYRSNITTRKLVIKLSLTWFISERRIQPSGAPYQLFATRHLLTIMAQPATTQLPYNEADILLAISAINTTQIPSNRHAAATFNVPKTTLRRRRAGVPL